MSKYSKEPECTLCGHDTKYFISFRERDYYRCINCSSVLMHPGDYVSRRREKERYEEHNNDVNNAGYQNFVMPVVSAVKSDFGRRDKGLDFGSGTGPVISKLLLDDGYNIVKYDPFFFNDPSKLQFKYDYIVCCEVMEHFHNPFREFSRLASMLKGDGVLFCMTYLYDESIDFEAWNYKNDETHVFFYHRRSLDWIMENIGFSKVDINGRLIRLVA